LHCHEVEEDVFRTNLQLLPQLVDDRPIERGLLLRARDIQENQLNEDAVFRPVDPEVVGVEKEVLRLVFADLPSMRSIRASGMTAVLSRR
jgi:hypothetical protein